MALVAYTKEDEKVLVNTFLNSKNNEPERRKLIDKFVSEGRNERAVYQKIYALKSKLEDKNKPKQVKKQASKSDVVVTHLNKSLETATIIVGDAKITIHSKKFKVNGIEIDC